jgi:hypothetical protein
MSCSSIDSFLGISRTTKQRHSAGDFRTAPKVQGAYLHAWAMLDLYCVSSSNVLGPSYDWAVDMEVFTSTGKPTRLGRQMQWTANAMAAFLQVIVLQMVSPCPHLFGASNTGLIFICLKNKNNVLILSLNEKMAVFPIERFAAFWRFFQTRL